MEMNCGACGSTRFRVSRFRVLDVPRLLILKYPVRCLSCQERTYASVSWVLEYKRKRAKRKQTAANGGPGA
jgi:hypothetical protein